VEAFFGRGPRAARGDVRTAVVSLLAEEPMHGYQIIGELRERSQGVWKASPGSVYPTLQLLEDEGLIKGEEADGKRVFHLTDAGRELVASRPAGAPAPWDEVGAGADAGVRDLRSTFFQLGGAVRQVVEAGSSSQIAAVKTILDEARRSIYRVLADDPSTEPTDPTQS
jgi:DNA-binding PadR family transcriptional regulator